MTTHATGPLAHFLCLVHTAVVWSSEGQDWFGVDLRLQLNAAPTDWEVLTSRKRVTDALSEWQVRPHKQHAHCGYMSLSAVFASLG